MAAAAILILPGCGSGSRGQGGTSTSRAPSDGDGFTLAGLSVSGGGAATADPASGGSGGDAGSVTVRSQNAVQVSADAPPDAPPIPAAANSIGDLTQDRVFSGSTVLSGIVTSSGPSAIRSITVNDGDLIVSGTLQSADLGDRAQGLSLSASGTIYISGTVKTEGRSGGSLTLRASRVVVTGTVVAGARSGSGGSGGAIRIESGGLVHLQGTIESVGGTVQGSVNGVRGGPGGTIAITSPSEVQVNALLRVRGGSARTSGAGALGGDGGALTIDNFAAVRLFGTVDAGGGSAVATSAGAGLRGGQGGRVALGVASPIASLTLQPGTIEANGGSGGDAGGHGGTLDLLSSGGGVDLAGMFSVEGGRSGVRSGDGGRIVVLADRFGGDLRSGATLLASGGSTVSASAGSGGNGGQIELLCWFDSTQTPSGSGGSMTLTASSVIAVDGGDSAGTAAAGQGGRVHLEIPQGTMSLSGLMTARGGSASGSGAGGRGGFLWIDSDSNSTSTGGAITLEAGAVLDASGGNSAGGMGGDALWSTRPGIIDPINIPIAILLDADSSTTTNPGGFVRNGGTVIARGGSPNGHGGDVEFHGLGDWTDPVTGEINPARGDVRNEGNGTGGNGVFTSD
jgi:hypothetical protein